MASEFNSPTSMRVFYTIWAGQTVSKLGSSLTSFAVGLWLFTEGGSVTAFALNNVFFLLPWALLSPVAGALVDRYDRKKIMIISDSVQALVFLSMGTLVAGLGLYGLINPRVRSLEDELQDVIFDASSSDDDKTMVNAEAVSAPTE